MGIFRNYTGQDLIRSSTLADITGKSLDQIHSDLYDIARTLKAAGVRIQDLIEREGSSEEGLKALHVTADLAFTLLAGYDPVLLHKAAQQIPAQTMIEGWKTSFKDVEHCLTGAKA